MNPELELVKRVRKGEPAALSELVELTKDMVFNLAIRMLGNPADAEDASQEILIRVISGLSDFRGDSKLRTWVYRVASNHLLTMKQRQTEKYFESLESHATFLDEGMASEAPPLENEVLLREAKYHCTSHMMLGLDREHRLAFVLGEILELSSEEGAAVLDVSPEAFRKRLSRARERMAGYASGRCGLVDEKNPCRCSKQIGHRVACGQFDAKQRPFTRFAERPRKQQDAELSHLDDLRKALEVFRSHPEWVAPESVASELRKLIERGPLN